MKPVSFTDEQCRQARMARDPRFDGRFFVGVHSTHIYCRNVCRVKPPLEHNVRYYHSAAAAEQAGLRPCLRCRPELAPPGNDLQTHQPRLNRALLLLQSGECDSVAELARQCHLSERQLRRLFHRYLGVAPRQALQTQRLLLAKQLLTDTKMPIIDIAFASGYGSVRRFNDAFVGHYRLAPTKFRQQAEDNQPVSAQQGMQLRLSYRTPYDYEAMLAFFAARAIDGIEWVEAGQFHKRLTSDSLLSVANDGDSLRVTLVNCSPQSLPGIVVRLRQMWDLDADPQVIATTLVREPQLGAMLQIHPGVRVAAYWDSWEALLRAILGQQVTIEAGRKLLTKLVELNQQAGGFGLPTQSQLLRLDLSSMGMPNSRKQTLHRVAEAAQQWELSQWPDIDEIAPQLANVKGIGPWTVNYWRLRTGTDADSLPLGDVVLRNAAKQQQLAEDDKALAQVAKRWQPWRSYATQLLWLSTME